MNQSSSTLSSFPTWNLTTIFPSLDSNEYRIAHSSFETQLTELEQLFDRYDIRRSENKPSQPANDLAEHLSTVVAKLNQLLLDGETVGAFLQLLITTDSFNAVAMKENSQLEMLGTRRQQLEVRLKGWLGSLSDQLPAIISLPPDLQKHQFVLEFLTQQSRYMMSEPMEDLAAQLSLDAGVAFGRLQGTITSQLTVPWKENGEEKHVPITMVRNKTFSTDPEVRERAYHIELKGWESIKATVAACLNGVKGSAITLAKLRNRPNVLSISLEQNRIDQQTLDALLGAIREYFPVFRRYFKAKAKKIGREQLKWWDIFAPLGHSEKVFTWPEARDFVVEKFSRFSTQLGQFAKRSFDENWIDAQPRAGKRGGAFCMPVPGREESRVLMNFDGSFEQLMTLAHELGHAFHNECQNGLEMLRRGSPMTLAETASIFCETLMSNAALEVASHDEQLMILDAQLAGTAQVCVDISSRYLFETAVFERRAKGELGPDEFCDLMRTAQTETYGDAIDPTTYHPFMWLWKPHYYSMDENFYNYPYAFGQLFGLGLYAIFQKQGAKFVTEYEQLLHDTGIDYAATLAARFGLNIRERDFWRGSLSVVERQVEKLEKL